MDMLSILQGDALEQLRTLEGESVQCCVTSPPYWGLRDYGTAEWEGGEDGCDHSTPRSRGDDIREGDKQGTSAGSRPNTQRECKCGAKRIDSQLGLEKTPEEYVAKMVDVFREVRRVLRKDGTCWINLGDAYAHSCACGGGSPLSNPNDGRIGDQSPRGRKDDRIAQLKTGGTLPPGLKPKDLCGIPWRVAFALQSDGWWLRSDIIWAKPNPMPESVTDRPTKAHEYLFLLTKSANYFYDAEAIKEQNSSGSIERFGITENGQSRAWNTDNNKRDGRNDGTKSNEAFRDHVPFGRNKRSVWTIATAPYPEAHFATYPPDLIKPCILAGSRPLDTVLDPFAGSGTTGQVALEFGRKAVLIELNPKYVEMIKRRCYVTIGFF